MWGQLSTILQVAVQTRDNCMAFSANTGQGHQHSPPVTIGPQTQTWLAAVACAQTAMQASQISTSQPPSEAVWLSDIHMVSGGRQLKPQNALGFGGNLVAF